MIPDISIKIATKAPKYPSIGKLINFDAKNERATAVEVNTSPKASTEAAFNADELIF